MKLLTGQAQDSSASWGGGSVADDRFWVILMVKRALVQVP